MVATGGSRVFAVFTHHSVVFHYSKLIKRCKANNIYTLMYIKAGNENSIKLLKDIPSNVGSNLCLSCVWSKKNGSSFAVAYVFPLPGRLLLR